MQCRLVSKRPVLVFFIFLKSEPAKRRVPLILSRKECLRKARAPVWSLVAKSLNLCGGWLRQVLPSGYWPSSVWTRSQPLGMSNHRRFLIILHFVAGCVCIIVYLWKLACINGIFIFTIISLCVQSSNFLFKPFSVHLLAHSGVYYDVLFLLSK